MNIWIILSCLFVAASLYHYTEKVCGKKIYSDNHADLTSKKNIYVNMTDDIDEFVLLSKHAIK